MEIQDNSKTYLMAALLLVLIVGIGIISYTSDFGIEEGSVKVPERTNKPAVSRTTGKVTINVFPPDEQNEVDEVK